jgi:RHS repeat-associated protein
MLLTRGSNNYSNDANGNTLTGGGRTNTWDGANRLTQCVYGTTTTSHVYGADGLRRRTVQGTMTTDFVLDNDSVVRTVVGGTVDKTFFIGPRGPEYERTGGNAPLWNLYDGLGSVIGTVNASGTIVSARKYDVYGGVRALSGTSGTKHKFVGRLGHPSEDETGLIYMRARYMDPVTGSFVSEDSAKDGNNWFAYAASRPTCLFDPDGKRILSPEEYVQVMQACVNAVAFAAVLASHGTAWVKLGEVYLDIGMRLGSTRMVGSGLAMISIGVSCWRDAILMIGTASTIAVAATIDFFFM